MKIGHLKNWPSKYQWRQFFKVLNKKETIIFSVFIFLALGSFLSLLFSFYFENTTIEPKEGGVYIEGVVGFPRFINPVYTAPFDADRDLTELIYSGLMKYNAKGEVILDLAKGYEVFDEGRVYEFHLKDNLKWSDGEPLTADDVVFTIETIQNPSLKSPERMNWLGVKVEKLSKGGIRFELNNPSAIFLSRCTLKIMPKHVWEEVPEQNFPFSTYNQNPIGSGPYKLKTLHQDNEGIIRSLELIKNPHYYGNLPHIPQITFYFFKSEKELTNALKSNQILGASLLSADNFKFFNKEKFSEYYLSLPRYFAVFFNTGLAEGNAKVLADKNIRLALNYGTNKNEIINEVLAGYGNPVSSPILPEVFGFEEPSEKYEFNLEGAKKILEENGFVIDESGIRKKTIKRENAFSFKSDLKVGSQGTEVKELQKCLTKDPEVYPEGEITGYFGNKTKAAVIKFQEKYKEEVLTPYGLENGTGQVFKSTRTKLNEVCLPPPEETFSLSFTLITVNQPVLEKVANILKKQWENLGIEIEVQSLSIATLEKEIIKPRNYEMLLFGEVLDIPPDPYPFWHSSQVKDPGLNLANYENKDCDKLLEEARQTLGKEERKEKLESFQGLLIEDIPALFLYNPDYLYLVSKEIKGVSTEIITDPSKRFSEIEKWYIKTKRVWK